VNVFWRVLVRQLRKPTPTITRETLFPILETFIIFETLNKIVLNEILLDEADEFISQLDPMTIKKIFYNIDIAEQTNDPKLFKKLQNDI